MDTVQLKKNKRVAFFPQVIARHNRQSERYKHMDS